jgi:hypothetical protein
MTTAVRTSTPGDLADALDGLAAAAEQAGDDPCTRAVLAVVVQRLEESAGVGLGETCADPLVVLQRRFGRAHARLAAGGTGDTDLLLGLARALQPQPSQDQQPTVPTVRAAALAGC